MRKVGNFLRNINNPGLHATGVFAFILLPFIALPSTQDPELMPRMVLISLFTAVAAGYMLYAKKELVLSGQAKIVAGILTATMVWAGVSMVSSINPGDAFTEWTRLAVFCSLFFCLYVILSENPARNALTICRYAMIAVFIFSIIGIYQAIEGLKNYNDLGYSLANSLDSTLSNKNFFSECLVLFLPFLLYGIIKDKGYFKVGFIISTFLNVILILIIQSSGSWLALIVSAIFYLIISIRTKTFNIRKFIPLIAIFSICIAIVFYLSRSEKSIISIKVKSIVNYIHNPDLINTTREENNNSVFERLLLWRNTISMIGDHPVAGVGLNNWKIINPVYGIGGTQFTNTGLMSYEHPHNDYLLVLAEEGPVGLILYLSFFFIVIVTGLKLLKNPESDQRNFVSLLISGVVAFSVLSLMSYPRSRAYEMLLLMMLSALILAFVKTESTNKISLKVPVFVILIIGMTGVVVFANRVIDEIHSRKAIISQLRSNFPRMYSEADKADSWLFPLDITSTPLSWYKGMAKFYMNDLNSAMTEYEKAIKIHPNHLRILNDLATTYEKSGRRTEAIHYYRKALDISPLFVEGNLNISAAYYNSGNIDSAYYYINRIKDEPRSMQEESNYKVFLKAITERKSELEIKN